MGKGIVGRQEPRLPFVRRAAQRLCAMLKDQGASLECLGRN